jgi:hypothetical protein
MKYGKKKPQGQYARQLAWDKRKRDAPSLALFIKT